MIGPKRKFYVLALNALATFALAGIVGTAFTHTARAAAQDSDANLKQFIRKSCANLQSNAPASLKNNCEDAQEQSYRNDVAKWNLDSTNSEANRYLLKQLKDEYQKQLQKNKDMQKAKSALENSNSLLEKKNRALRKQASQACSTASGPGSVIKNAGLSKTRSLGEHESQPPTDPKIDLQLQEKMPVNLDVSLPDIKAAQ